MIIKPSMTSLLKKVPNKYSLVVGTAKRARQISLGAPKLTDEELESDVSLAATEVDEGKIGFKK